MPQNKKSRLSTRNGKKHIKKQASEEVKIYKHFFRCCYSANGKTKKQASPFPFQQCRRAAYILSYLLIQGWPHKRLRGQPCIILKHGAPYLNSIDQNLRLRFSVVS